MPDYIVSVSDADAAWLRKVAGSVDDGVAGDVRDLLEHLARSAADGARRPGSWERAWVTQATGWPSWDPDVF